MILGVISDTHGYLDPQIPELFQNVEHILHGGDVGPYSILQELEQIAPVTAVLGNTDTFLDLRETEVVPLADRRFLVHHIVDPQALTEPLVERLQREPPDVVVFGHTHKPFCDTIGKTLFLNPGYAGRRRFQLPRTVALLHCTAAGLRVEFKPLDR